MNLWNWLQLGTVLLLGLRTECYHLLGVFPAPGLSHQILCTKLMKGLLRAGHDVTIVSPYSLGDVPQNGGKLTEIVIDVSAAEFHSKNRFDLNNFSVLDYMRAITNAFIHSTNVTLNHPALHRALEDQKFDALIVEQFGNDALKVLSHVANCPLITLSSLGPNSWSSPTVGNPQPVSYVPHLYGHDFSNDLSLLNRAKNLLLFVMEYFVDKFHTFPAQEKLQRQAFPDSPPLFDLYTNVSLVLLNSHASLYPALPLVPNMVEIGGYFVEPPRRLPRDLREFLDGAAEGAIYFSMGSNLKGKHLPAEKRRVILSVLRRLEVRVLWKFEEELPDKPANVMIRPWLPQQDVLAHPNVKLFITHGGLLSTTETIYHGVPVLAIPVFGDQSWNADRAVSNGYGLKLDYNDPDFTEGKLYGLIRELLTEPRYRENAKTRSRIYHDRPMPPMKTAVYWVEYVIRHKGAPHLRVAGVRQPWYEYFMVDVLAVITLGLVMIGYGVRAFVKARCWFTKVKIN